jgi:putative ABC transport system permease protein
MSVLNRKLVRDISRFRGQLAAVSLVVACGIATYVTMRGSYISLVEAQQSYYGTYRFADVFAQLKRAPEPLAAEIAAIPGVSKTETRVVVEVTLDIPGLDEPATGRLVSIPEAGQPDLNKLHIKEGRYVEPGRRDEVLVSEAFAEANQLRSGASFGAVINGRWQQLRIAGIALSPEYIYEIRSAAVFPDNRRFGALWMAREALGSAFEMEGAFNNVVLALAPGASESQVIRRLDILLERYGGLGAYGRDDQESHRFITDEISQDRITGIFLPAIFLWVASFLVHLVLSRLVSTERAQIAVLKAFGFSNAGVAAHYLKFALIAVLGGTVAGIGLGAWLGTELSKVYEDFFRFPELRFRVGLDTAGLAALISAGAALVGAALAVLRVAGLPPAEAMRPESPAAFKAGLLERLSLDRLFPPSAKMILRNLQRRRWKSALTIATISLAVAILVVGRYTFDALDYILDVHFRAVQREDVSVTFNEPRSSSVQFEIRRWSGVIHAEPFRLVPARLRSGHRSKRVALIGIAPGAQLRSLLDARLNEVDLPPEGVVLTRKLAEVLGAGTGHDLTVEVLEGERPVRRVRIAGQVDELIGLAAYMDIRALNRLMREGGTISGAYLAVDPALLPRLYHELKQTPGVGSVAIRQAMLTSFLETIAASLTVSTTVLILFACVIAFGVVYNGARIALSERGHELASLRVLGFTRWEIAVILIGEQAILTMAAVPAGFLAGFAICALLVRLLESELYRMPLVVTGASYAFAFLVVTASAAVSALVVLRRIYRLDLVAVLKSRE